MAKYKKRVTRKQLLKEPDEFITTTGRIIRFATTYRKQLLCSASLFLIVLFSVLGFRYYSNWKEKRAFTVLDRVMVEYNQALEAESDLSSIKAGFQEIVDGYSGYAGGKMARVIYANICYRTDDHDTAISLYTEALDDFVGGDPIRVFIQSSLGYAYEAKKDYLKAASYFNEIVTQDDAVLKDEALFNMARLYDKAGNKDKSTEAYKKILSDHSDSQYIEIVKEKLLLL